MVILDRIRLPEEIPMNTNYPFLCSFIKKSGKIKMAFSPLFSIFCILVFNHFFQKRQTFLKLTPSVTFYSFLRREILQLTSFPPGHSLQLAPLSPKSQNEQGLEIDVVNPDKRKIEKAPPCPRGEEGGKSAENLIHRNFSCFHVIQNFDFNRKNHNIM